MKKLFPLLLLSTMTAQSISDYPYTSAKPTGMVGAVVSEKGSSWSMFHNPAGIVEIDKIHFSIGNAKLYGFNWLSYNQMNCYLSTPIIGKIGIAISQLKTQNGEIALSEEQTLSFAQGFLLQQDKNSHLSIGYTANFIQWNLGESAGLSGDGTDGLKLGNLNTTTFDFGLLASLRSKYRFGVFMKNIFSSAMGTGSSRQILPRRINLGITYSPITNFSSSIMYEKLLGRDDLQLKGSISYKLNSHFELFAGVQANPNRFGMGTSITFIGQEISYGILTHPVLPITQQLNLIIFP